MDSIRILEFVTEHVIILSRNLGTDVWVLKELECRTDQVGKVDQRCLV